MARKPQSKEVSSVAVFNEDGMLLFARRRDSGKWTLPGGHIEEGESAEEAAIRELLEETGLSADSIEVLGHCDIKDKNLTIYSFQVTVPKDEYPEDCNDPDEECDEFRWVNPDVIPPEILTNLHSPENVTLQLLGLQEKTLPLKGEEDDLEKSDKKDFRNDPKYQKALALKQKISGITSSGPKPSVWKNKHNTDGRVVVSLDPSKPGSWRVTHFDKEIPTGHFEAPTHEEALWAAHRSGADLLDGGVGGFAPEKVNKAEPKTKYWRSRDGIRIPSVGSPQRAEYENSFKNQVVNVFAQGNQNKIKHVVVPTDKLFGSNMPVNKDRLNLYTRMLRAGDDVPPVVIRQTGPDSYHLVDGNHRQAAAQAVGKKQIRAFLLKDPYPSKGMGIKNIKKSEARTSRIKPMNPQLPFLMHLNFHPHDNEVWVENNSLVKSQTLEAFEKLIKGKKDGLKMYGATPTPEQKAHVDWSYSKLPNENWATWSIRGHRENPSAFTPEVKQKLEHYALHPSSDIQNIRFDKSHDLNSGLQMLKDADSLHKLKGRLAEKPETANKIMDAGNGFEWWDLGKSQCSSEGKAMEHCGNDFDPQEGDNLLSLRKKHVIGGKTYYEPHLTFVENNGVLTEMRGRGNTKPEEEYHPAIAQLLKGGHLPVGVEYSPEGNFSVDDFSEGVYDSVKRANPKISLYRDDDKEVPDSSLLNLYAKRHPVESIHDRFRQAFLSRLTELDNLRYPQLARNLRNNKSAAMELAYDVDLPQDIQPVLASLDNKEINRALAFRDDLNPELQVNFAKNPDLAHTISEKHDLAQDVHPILASYNDESINKNLASLKDLHPDVLDKFIENPNLHKILADNAHLPKHLHARLASLGDSQIKRKLLAAQGNKISSEAVSLLANELMENPDDAIAEKLARLENLPPELHSKVASAGNNENIVQELLSKRKDLNPDTFKLLAQNPKLASWLVKNPNLPPELHTNIAAHGDHEANVELARFTKPELLKHLIDTNGVGSWVHEAAAQNKNITPELLKHLVEKNQAGSIVHLNAVMNQNIHPELLKHLIDVNKPGSRIHEYAAINPQITPDAFKHLIENNKSGSLVHLAAALNKNIIPETLKYLVERNEAGSEVHHRAAENPNLTLEAARYIASKNRPDSNIHRLAQEAIRRLSSGNVNKSESLDKNLAGLLTGAALNLMSSNPSATAQKPVAQARPSWSPEGLHQDMLPIAHLESNFGKNTQHAAHSKGEYHTAVGAVGLKPVTAHEEYKKSKAIQKAFPGLEEPSDFVQRMKSDNQFYNLLATSHFLRLKARHGSPERAAFAWRWGTGAAQNASDEQVSSDPYVQKYVQIANKLKAKQALALKSEQDVWGMPIEKAIDPKEFKSIVRASTPEGKNHVDHTLHLNEHPEEHRDWVSGYRNEILGSPKSYKKLKKAQDGITKKVILTQNTPAGDTEKFMVKPYHERVIKRTQGWQKFPIQGWAEMTNQALYHAGDIGHLHQKVHVSEHNMGENNQAEPALVVHLEKGFQPVQNKRAELESLQLSRHFSHKTQQDALKIGLMDFLTNNLDRHGGNLMVSDNNEDLKAIDHSRSFQYINNRSSKWKRPKNPRQLEDKLSPYIRGLDTAVGVFVPSSADYDDRIGFLQDHAAPVFDWWGRVGKNVRDTMYKHLEAIKNPEVRAHIKRNFDARADWLDERAEMGIENYGEDWHHDSVPQYRPHEKTDEEVEQEKIKAIREEWQKGGK